ncbi:MAG: pre-16S rRNA-processing nuclease YqgF [Armatimonadetes bacterium]|nr:pre-16S rRNA-processing nuclease YqgF [Armatimonadota bacterium]
MTAPRQCILAIDPGKARCGLAVVAFDGSCLDLSVSPTMRLTADVTGLIARHSPALLLVGDSTGRGLVLDMLRPVGVPVQVVTERGTTLAARALYFRDTPPRGFARLIPAGMRVPPRPVDDYAALAIALDWLSSHPEGVAAVQTS